MVSGARFRLGNPLTFGFTDLKFGTWDIGRNESVAKAMLESGAEANGYRRLRTMFNQAVKIGWSPMKNLARVARAKSVDVETGRDVDRYLELSGLAPKWLQPLIDNNIISKDLRIPIRHLSTIRGATGVESTDELIKEAMGLGAVLAGSNQEVTSELRHLSLIHI